MNANDIRPILIADGPGKMRWMMPKGTFPSQGWAWAYNYNGVFSKDPVRARKLTTEELACLGKVVVMK